MAKTVVGLYESSDRAQRAIEDLVDAGFRREDISLTARSEEHGHLEGGGGHETEAGSGAATGAGIGAGVGGIGGLLVGLGLLTIPGLGPIVAAGPLAATLAGMGVGAAAGGLVGGLVGLGIPEEDADRYAEGVSRGGYLVIVNAPDAEAERAADILDRYDPLDIDERSMSRSDAGLVSDRAETVLPTTPAYTEDRRDTVAEQTIPIVEEELRVGKRQVERGGVRVRSYVVEKPVETDITTREETVHVERRPVDRPVSGGDAAFQERVVEVTATGEEPVIAKEQRVVEEVAIGKDVTERQERVSDTVRRTEVEVDDEKTGKDRVPHRG